MRIHHKSGEHSDVAIEQIDSITFVDGIEVLDEEVSLTGSWLWGDTEAGYYELLTFNEDKTYTGYDKHKLLMSLDGVILDITSYLPGNAGGLKFPALSTYSFTIE